jgi:acetyl-CoA C-acetyltransferase
MSPVQPPAVRRVTIIGGTRIPGGVGGAGAGSRGPRPSEGERILPGHRAPFAATGARSVAPLAKSLAKSLAEQGGSGRGLISVRAVGGQGVTAVLERG